MEQSLIDHVRRGERLDLASDDGEEKAVDEAAMRSWDDSRTCRATVIRDILRGRLAPDSDPHGLQLRGARITGRIDLENLTTNVDLQLTDCFLEEGLLALDARLAFVGLTGCRLEHPAEVPMYADRLTCSALFLKGTTVIGHAEAGAVRLLGAHISGNLECDGAHLSNDSGPALHGDGLQVDREMFLRGGFTATGEGAGAVRLLGAQIGGNLECERAHLRNSSGPALAADGMQVGRGMFLSGGFTGDGDFGAVRLIGAHIGLQLSCIGASLRNDSGPALNADDLQVGQGMFLTGGFTATGDGDFGAVRLLGAHIGGNLAGDGAHLRNGSGPALNADGLQVGRGMFLRDGFTACGGGDVTVDLTDTRVGGALVFDPARLEHATVPYRRLAVNGLTYSGVPERISAQEWLRLLREGTCGYAAQPYQQLAAGHRALGHEREAREVLMAQRDHQLARTDTRWSERLWGRITKVTLGYGYQPWRALLFLAGVVALSCVLAVVLGSHGALAQNGKTAAPGRSCTLVQQVSVGLDLNLPVGTSMARAACDLAKDSASATADWLAAAGWVLRLLAWVFAALFIAGFTSAVRKS